MIGTAIKKYAASHGMTCGEGYAYGKVNGCYIALEDGSGTKTLQIYLYPPAQNTVENEEKLVRVRRALLDCDAKEYRLAKQNPIVAEAGRVRVVFHDNPGTMARIERYIDEIMPRLNDLELGETQCAFCAEPLSDDTRFVALDDYVLPVHAGCVQEMMGQVESMEAEPKPGSVAMGALGAIAGAMIGAIPWALVFMMGYVTSLVGLLIGYLSNLLYGKFGGKNCRMRVVIVIIALILGVGLGQAAGYTLQFAKDFDSEGGLDEVGMTCVQYIQSSWDQYLVADEDVMLGNYYDRMISNVPLSDRGDYYTRSEFIRINRDAQYATSYQEANSELTTNLMMGIFFGMLGCIGVFGQLFKETKRRSVRALK